jgi:hypothetical protein
MSRTPSADDQLVVVIEESSPSDGAGGITYVVAAAALFEPITMSGKIGAIFGSVRTRPFHWNTEGPTARQRTVDLLLEEGVIALVTYAHVGRRTQVASRQRMIAVLSRWAVAEGAGHIIIESGDAATDGRDKATLLDTHRNDGGVPFTYAWETKAEPLLWLADAIAGAVGEHLVGKDSTWFDQLEAGGVIQLEYTEPQKNA